MYSIFLFYRLYVNNIHIYTINNKYPCLNDYYLNPLDEPHITIDLISVLHNNNFNSLFLVSYIFLKNLVTDFSKSVKLVF